MIPHFYNPGDILVYFSRLGNCSLEALKKHNREKKNRGLSISAGADSTEGLLCKMSDENPTPMTKCQLWPFPEWSNPIRAARDSLN